MKRSGRDLLLRKLRDWQTETEYRFVVLGRDEAPKDIEFGDALVAMCLGDRVERDDELELAREYASEDLDVRKLVWDGRVPRAPRIPPS